jgi:hypothetical protein
MLKKIPLLQLLECNSRTELCEYQGRKKYEKYKLEKMHRKYGFSTEQFYS